MDHTTRRLKQLCVPTLGAAVGPFRLTRMQRPCAPSSCLRGLSLLVYCLLFGGCSSPLGAAGGCCGRLLLLLALSSWLLRALRLAMSSGRPSSSLYRYTSRYKCARVMDVCVRRQPTKGEWSGQTCRDCEAAMSWRAMNCCYRRPAVDAADSVAHVHHSDYFNAHKVSLGFALPYAEWLQTACHSRWRTLCSQSCHFVLPWLK